MSGPAEREHTRAHRAEPAWAAHLAEQGWAAVHGLLGPQEVAALHAAIETLRATTPPSREVLYTHAPPPTPRPGLDRLMEQWLDPHRRAPVPAALARAAALAATALPEGATLFQDLLLVKHPHHAPFPWHQDYPFWPIDRPAGVVVWVALDAVGPDNGGLALASGSHRGGTGPAIDLHTGAPQAGAPAGARPALGETVPALLPGDAVVFDALTWHRSGRNTSAAQRRAWASSWVSARCRWAPERAPRHPLAGTLVAGALVGGR